MSRQSAGLAGARYIAAYAAAKHAVIGLTRSVAAELEGTKVTCNAVCPGFVDTEMTKESVARIVAKTGKTPAETLAAMLTAAGQARLITPDEVAQGVLRLSDPHGQRPQRQGRHDRRLGGPWAFDIIILKSSGSPPSGWNHGMLSHPGGRILFVAGQIVPSGRLRRPVGWRAGPGHRGRAIGGREA